MSKRNNKRTLTEANITGSNQLKKRKTGTSISINSIHNDLMFQEADIMVFGTEMSNYGIKAKSVERYSTIISFDYDNTIFPTKLIQQIFKRKRPLTNTLNWNSSELLLRISEREKDELYRLSWITLNLLTTYITKYSANNIFIVSASSNGWIKHSLSILKDIGYYSVIYNLLLNQVQIKMIHPPRTLLINCNYQNIINWKFQQFYAILNENTIFSDKLNDQRYQKRINTFISIGDSECEYIAAGKLREYWFKNPTFIHRVKFMDNPTLNDLCVQQQKIYQTGLNFEFFSMNGTNQDIVYQK